MYGCHTKNIFARMDACESLLNRNKIDPFLKRMVTGDEKLVTYDNVKRKRSWSNKVGISLGTRHRTKRRIFDLNRIIVTNFMNN